MGSTASKVAHKKPKKAVPKPKKAASKPKKAPPSPPTALFFDDPTEAVARVQVGGEMFDNGTNNAGRTPGGWTIFAYSRAARTFDLVLLWLLSFTFFSYAITVVYQKGAGEFTGYDQSYVEWIMVALAVVAGLSTTRFFFHGLGWVDQVLLVICTAFVYYLSVTSFYLFLTPQPSDPGTINDGGESEEDVAPRCRPFTIDSVKRDPNYIAMRRAFTSKNERAAKRALRKLNLVYHPDRCIKIGCVETCTETFTFIRNEADKGFEGIKSG